MSKELITICDNFNAELERDDTENEKQCYDHHASEEQEDE